MLFGPFGRDSDFITVDKLGALYIWREFESLRRDMKCEARDVDVK